MKKNYFVALFFLLLLPTQAALASEPPEAASFIIPTELRIGLLDNFYNRQSIVIDDTEIIYTLGESTGRLESPHGFVVMPLGEHGIVIFGSGENISTPPSSFEHSPVLRDARGAPISIGGSQYRGGVEFLRASAGITAVNIVPLEEYLFSVVPAEMPALWSPHALKAQAIAARTYAIYNLTGNTHEGFHLCDRVCCQRYVGVSSEHINTNMAVMATAGRILLYEGQPINAVYFACSGGFTENSENVWQQQRPYLRGVPDPHEHETPEWTRSFTFAEITRLAALNEANIGNTIGVSAAEHVLAGNTPTGRKGTLTIQGTHGNVTLHREEIRRFFAPSENGMLPSRMFTILPRPGGNGIIITGRGAGHGVGMSQRSAESQARQGRNYTEILKHFYRGVTLSD